ncbi:MAG: MCE family protein [Planctomycetes bacterium]|nr:MCE family protein [Planctomycetota bacterium]
MRYRDFAIGLIFVGSIAVVGAITLAVKGPSMLWGRTLPTLRVWFPNVYGLQPGDEVRTAGMRVGQVEKVEYHGGRVLVESAMLERVRISGGTDAERARFRIRAKSALGGRYLDIEPGSGPEAEGGTVFAGEEGGDVFEQLAGFLERNREPIDQIIRHFEQITEDIRNMAEVTRKGQGALGTIIYNPELAESLREAIENIRGISEGIQDGEGSLGKLVKDPALFDDLTAAVQKVNRGEGPIGILLNDQEAGQQVRETVANVREIVAGVRAGEGTIGKLFRETKLHDLLADALVDARAAIRELREGEGLLPALLSDPAIRERFVRIVTNVDEITHKVNQGDGTVAQLINNSEAWDEITRILFLVRESVEDVREQAPINTFTNVLFSVF